ncbi:peptide ABC transporter substrate-binding protein [Mobilicoccus pelagius]|uniref:Putative peptide ABC transporter substrate-binding protein n=1 Tax=Mobilicoccus pelagius NBRC 104925 TaxID=1089455 RepID=H5UV46_9MICO|nr:ABC transporter substrate-binding protein [Mobilicoccus pelagius]GAB49604.1 putative peptide ABC transporter substrate-binding protein [Mobilicoccus pelagius NBRC 104925]
MQTKTRAALVAGLSATTLLAACGGGGGGSNGSGDSQTQASGQAGGSISVRGCNPQNPLVPANTTETCGGNVLDVVTAKLVAYNPDTAAPENDIAESIETKDNQNFTVKIKPGYKFHDGTEIKANNFVDAWNYAAYAPNAQSAAYFMEPIEGYTDLQPAEGADASAKPKADKLTGLKVVDDHTFTIKTTEKVSNLPLRLGYTAFAPLPESFFKDPKAYGEKPVGAGPYTVEKWDKNQQIVLKKFADYTGARPGKADEIVYRIYQDSEAAYKDVMANKLDATDEIPESAMIGKQYQSDLPERTAEKDEGLIQTATFAPVKVDPTMADPKVRQAVSMAIDRDTIIQQIFDGSRKPATGWVSPVVDGYKADQCGEFCTYDPAKAKQTFDQAKVKPSRITLSYNGDASHKAWTEATCNSIKQALGVDCVATPVVDFKTFRTQVTSREMKGMFRTGWQMDYPSIENFLTPVFATGGSSNDGDYSNPKFDAKLKEAAAATDANQANTLYQEAEAMLTEQMPAVPLWYGHRIVGWSENVTDVKIDPFGRIDLTQISKKA